MNQSEINEIKATIADFVHWMEVARDAKTDMYKQAALDNCIKVKQKIDTRSLGWLSALIQHIEGESANDEPSISN